MLAFSQLLILLVLVNSIAAANAQSDELRATLARIDELKSLECASYNVLFDLCICLKREVESGADMKGLIEAVAEWELATESGLANWSSITDVRVEPFDIAVSEYEGQQLDAVQMRVLNNTSFRSLVTGDLYITLSGKLVESTVRFRICFSA